MSLKETFKKYFLPHPGNDHKPHLLRAECAIALALIIIFAQAALLGQVAFLAQKPGFTAAVLPSVLVDLTNEDRAENQAAPLKANPLLAEAANLKAQDMALKGYFAHNTPEGYLPWYWLQKVGYSYKNAGENLAVNFFDSSDVAEAWMNSPEHRANVVNKAYTDIGIGMAEGVYQGHDTIFVVEFFGTPAPSKVAALPSVQAAALHIPKKALAVALQLKQSSTTAAFSAASGIASTSPAAIAQASEGPQVAGASVVSAAPQQAPQSDLPLFLQEVIASPHLLNTYLLSLLLGIVFIGLASLALSRRSFGHKALFLNGAGLAAAIVFLLAANHYAFSSGSALPQGSEAASVSDALPLSP